MKNDIIRLILFVITTALSGCAIEARNAYQGDTTYNFLTKGQAFRNGLQHGDQQKVIQYYSPQLAAQPVNGRYPLEIAASKGMWKAFANMVDRGAPLHLRSSSESFAYLAAVSGEPRLGRVMAQKGCGSLADVQRGELRAKQKAIANAQAWDRFNRAALPFVVEMMKGNSRSSNGRCTQCMERTRLDQNGNCYLCRGRAIQATPR